MALKITCDRCGVVVRNEDDYVHEYYIIEPENPSMFKCKFEMKAVYHLCPSCMMKAHEFMIGRIKAC